MIPVCMNGNGQSNGCISACLCDHHRRQATLFANLRKPPLLSLFIVADSFSLRAVDTCHVIARQPSASKHIQPGRNGRAADLCGVFVCVFVRALPAGIGRAMYYKVLYLSV